MGDNKFNFHRRTEKLPSGNTWHFVDEKPSGWTHASPTLLLLHGFPDAGWYGWRYQIRPWVKRGYRVLAPDMLGYGGTSKPEDSSQYSTRLITTDLASLLDLDDIKVNKAVVIGHDWGADVAWRFCLWQPERVRMVIGLSVPFYPPSPTYIPIKVAIRKVPGFGYQVWFEDPASTQEIEQNLSNFFDAIFRSPAQQGWSWAKEGELRKLVLNETPSSGAQDLLTNEELEYFLNFFKNSMGGPLSYYKTRKIRHDEEKAAARPSRLPSTLPALFVRGTEDPSSPPAYARRAHNFVPSLKVVTLDGAGHWLMLERTDEVNRIVGEWIDETIKNESKTQSKL